MTTAKVATSPKSSLRYERTHRKILDSAEGLFLAHGFAGATTDMIQMDSGVSKSTLYSYFPTKDALFEAVCEARSASFEQSLTEAADADETDVILFLNRFGNAFLRILTHDDSLAFYRLMVAESVRFPRLGNAFYHAGIKASTEMIETYLARAHADGRLHVPSPMISAEHLIGMLKGDIHQRVLLNIGKRPRQDQLRRYVAVTVENFLLPLRANAKLPATGPRAV